MEPEADSGRFGLAPAPTEAVTQELDPRVHHLRKEHFAKKMDCRQALQERVETPNKIRLAPQSDITAGRCEIQLGRTDTPYADAHGDTMLLFRGANHGGRRHV